MLGGLRLWLELFIRDYLVIGVHRIVSFNISFHLDLRGYLVVHLVLRWSFFNFRDMVIVLINRNRHSTTRLSLLLGKIFFYSCTV